MKAAKSLSKKEKFVTLECKTVEMDQCSTRQYVWLLTERMVEHFLARLFLRNPILRSLTLVSPFINTMADCRYSLADLSIKIRVQRTPTYVVTREPAESWQQEAVDLLAKNEWVEIRFNELLHAKVFVASAIQESESFAVFGSGNLTGAAATSNLEVGMMLLARGTGRKLVDELYYWSTNNLRVLPESTLYGPWAAPCQNPIGRKKIPKEKTRTRTRLLAVNLYHI